MITRHVLFGIRHHDLPSLMAGKIRAMLTRPYAKGRDWFDLLWYGSQIPVVEPFLERYEDIAAMSAENLKTMLKS